MSLVTLVSDIIIVANTGCNLCKSDSEEKVTCTDCIAEYGLGICEACTPSNCAKCDKDNSKCEKCDDGYYLENDACTG